MDTPQDADFSRALDSIFANGLTELVPELPEYWQRFAKENFTVPQQPNSPTIPASEVTKKIGGGVKPPVLVKSVVPQLNQIARNLQYSGKSLINFWVGGNGIPYHFAIVAPAGIGLDEQALYAVQQYRFKPATENDKPVLVELNVEIKFDIY